MEERKERQQQTLSLRLRMCLLQSAGCDAAATLREWPAGPRSAQGLNGRAEKGQGTDSSLLRPRLERSLVPKENKKPSCFSKELAET